MNAYKLILLCMIALGALVNVALIGKPRKPMTPGVAAVVLVINGIYAALVVLA